MKDEDARKRMSYAARRLEEFFEDFIKVNKGELEIPKKLSNREERKFSMEEDAWVCYRILHTPEREEKVGDKTVTIPEVTFGKEIEIKKGKEYYQVTHAFNVDSSDITKIYLALYTGGELITTFRHVKPEDNIKKGIEAEIISQKEVDTKLEEACKKFGVNWPYKSEPDYVI